jgi:hypothetical protein
MLPQPLTGRMDGVGEVLKTNPLQGTTRPLKFLRTVIFLKIKRDGNRKLWQDHQNRPLTLMSSRRSSGKQRRSNWPSAGI